MKISVALAYYRGEKYIEEQLRSILPQLSLTDEVVISVDEMTESGKTLLRSLQDGDDRIRILRGPGKGVVRNFDRAIRACRGDIIFLSDQDDIWVEHKVTRVVQEFEEPEVMAVLHNAEMINESGRRINEPTLFEFRRSSSGLVKNMIRNSYVGCCMAFRRELVPLICPIPKEMYMHDFWIGMAAKKTGKVVLIQEPLIYYRRHGANLTDLSHGPLGFMVTKRINMIRCLRLLDQRIKNLASPDDKRDDSDLRKGRDHQEVRSDQGAGDHQGIHDTGGSDHA